MKVEVQVDNGLLLIDGAAIPILTPRFERPRRWKVSAPTGREAPPMPWLVGAARASFLHASRSASEALIRVVDPAGWPAWERVRDPEDGALAPVVRWVEWSQHWAPAGPDLGLVLQLGTPRRGPPLREILDAHVDLEPLSARGAPQRPATPDALIAMILSDWHLAYSAELAGRFDLVVWDPWPKHRAHYPQLLRQATSLARQCHQPVVVVGLDGPPRERFLVDLFAGLTDGWPVVDAWQRARRAVDDGRHAPRVALVIGPGVDPRADQPAAPVEAPVEASVEAAEMDVEVYLSSPDFAVGEAR